MQLFEVYLTQPRYHFMMAIIALIVLGVVLLAWYHINSKLDRQRKILVSLYRLQMPELKHEKFDSAARGIVVGGDPKLESLEV